MSKAKKVKRKAKAARRSLARGQLLDPPTTGPRVLLFDVETAPILADVWALWDQNIGLNQIKKDSHLLSWSAKWLGAPASQVMYADQRDEEFIEADKPLVQGLWTLLNQADIVITQNGKAFDQKVVQTRMLVHSMNPPSSYRHIDTLLLAKKHFKFSSNKLEYMTHKFNKVYKKLKHSKYPGHEMWTECMAGNVDAWREMERYNKLDVLALEELYKKLIPWDDQINFSVYTEGCDPTCKCGSTDFRKYGFHYTNHGKFQRWRCVECGAETRETSNLLNKEQKAGLRIGTPR